MRKRFVILLLFLALPPLVSPLYRSYEALQLLRQMGGRGTAAFISTAQVQQVEFADRGQIIKAELYQGAAPALAAIVLQHGAAAGGKDDPRLVALARQLAQARFAVLVPEMPGARALQVSSAEIPLLLGAVDYLHARRDQLFQGPLGIGGFSVAAGLAIHAALQHEPPGQIDFILGVGAYYDLPQTLDYMTTGYFKVNGRRDYRQPNEYGKWVFVLSNVHRLENPQQRQLLRQISARHLAADTAAVEELVAHLRGDALAVYRYIDNRDPQRATALQQQLPQALREEISRLDLADKNLTALRAKVLLLHGRGDAVIPYTQSIALAAALPAGQTTLFVLRNWAHVNTEGAMMDGWQMFRALYALLRLRDGNP